MTTGTTYNADLTTLGPLTRAIVESGGGPGVRSPFYLTPTVESLGTMLDAIHALEQRVIAIETP